MPRLAGEEPPARNAVIRWHTGSGKTLAYALPLMAKIDYAEVGVQALVVTPTRELCLQTLHVLQKLTKLNRSNKKGNFVKVASLMGRPTPRMLSEIRHHPPDIVVGTPQTVAALMTAGALPLARDERRRTLVIDEIDAFGQPYRWASLAQILACGTHADGRPRREHGRRLRPPRRGASGGGGGEATAAAGDAAEDAPPPLPPPPSASAPPAGERRRTVWSKGGVWLVSGGPRPALEPCARELCATPATLPRARAVRVQRWCPSMWRSTACTRPRLVESAPRLPCPRTPQPKEDTLSEDTAASGPAGWLQGLRPLLRHPERRRLISRRF